MDCFNCEVLLYTLKEYIIAHRPRTIACSTNGTTRTKISSFHRYRTLFMFVIINDTDILRTKTTWEIEYFHKWAPTGITWCINKEGGDNSSRQAHLSHQNSDYFHQSISCIAKQSLNPSPAICTNAQFEFLNLCQNQKWICNNAKKQKKWNTCSGSRLRDLSSFNDPGLGKVPRNPFGSLDGLAYRRGCLWTSPWDIKFLNKSMWWGASASSITMTRLPKGKPPPKISTNQR